MRNIPKPFIRLASAYVSRTRLLSSEELEQETELLSDLAEMEEQLCASFGLPPVAEWYGRLQEIALSEARPGQKIVRLHEFLLQTAMRHFRADVPTDRAYLMESKEQLRSPLDVLPMLGFVPSAYNIFLLSGRYYRGLLNEAELLQELKTSDHKACNTLHRRFHLQQTLTPALLKRVSGRLRYVPEFYANRELCAMPAEVFIRQGGPSVYERTIPDGTEYWCIEHLALSQVRFLPGDKGEGEVGMDALVWGKGAWQREPLQQLIALVAGTDAFCELLRHAPDHSTADVLWTQYRQFLTDPDYSRDHTVNLDLRELYHGSLLLYGQGMSLLHIPMESDLDLDISDIL